MAKQPFCHRLNCRSSFVIQLRLIVSFLCVLAPTLFSVGCEDSRSGPSASKQPEDTAQADFDWAMERLKRAVETWKPSAIPGLRMKRELSYEIHPPDASQPNYTALVTIKSKTFYKSGRQFPKADEDSKRAKATSPLAGDGLFPEEMLANRTADPTDLFDTDRTFPSSKPMIVNPPISTPRIDKLTVYELTYREGQWQLDTQPESKHEQLWFEYALQL